MSQRRDLLQARFQSNMRRINGLVEHTLIEPLKPNGLFQSDGVRADILRTIVVFLHASFEDVLRSHLPRQNKKLTFSSGGDLDKALTLSGIDPKPFKHLFPPLTQMAKRRNRIVHNADLSNRTDTVSSSWGIVDDWQLIMWLMAVPAFYYQLRVSLSATSVVESTSYERLRKSMLSHVDFGNQLVALPKVPPDLRIEALQKVVASCETIAATLKLDISDLIVNEG